MQFYKKTSIGSSSNPLKIIIKVVLVIVVIFGMIVFVGKINFPSPNKLIEKKIPQENLKIVK
ncbi:hypothetical protein [Candidatus Pelagibacter communis]|uniref:hypothetical protein n=1 Tax=Pelagibacter ubique TaxID=198252 RepID=UPI00094BEFD3|nr:hypothetical protein [Candidatus Pelagibacter ubique]